MKCYDCPYSYQRGNNFPECIWQPETVDSLAPCEKDDDKEEKTMIRCIDCPYYYNIEINEIPECNWIPRYPGDCAPCEEEDYAEEKYYVEENENE